MTKQQPWYAPLLLVSALAAPAHAQEQMPAKALPVSQSQENLEDRLHNFKGFDDPRYRGYDAPIIELTSKYNALFKDKPGYRPLNPLLAKSMIIQESGGTPEAFSHDPMQIANKGDFALTELQQPDIYRRLGIEDLSAKYRAFTHTPRTRGRWDYSGDRSMRARESIEGGILFLLRKAFLYDERTLTSGDIYDHVITEGETFAAIAEQEASTIGTLRRLNPGVNPKKLRIDSSIHVQKAEIRPVITGTRSWRDAVILYNGGGTPGYTKKVFNRLRDVTP